PQDDSTQKVQYQPRLRNVPEFGTYFQDVIEGVLTYYDTDMHIWAEDWLQYFAMTYSFSQAEVAAWTFVNEPTNIERVYTGKITSVTYQRGTLKITVADTINKLRQPALMGDTPNQCYFNVAGFPNVDPNKTGTPVRFVT